MKKITNIVELRNEMCEAYLWVKDDPRRGLQVKEMANAAGKVLGSLKIQLENCALRKEKPNIKFLVNE